jgi:hypothetical protein
MKTVINLTAEEILDSYSSNYGQDLTPEQLSKIVDEVQGRADNFIAELLRDLFEEVFHA